MLLPLKGMLTHTISSSWNCHLIRHTRLRFCVTARTITSKHEIPESYDEDQIWEPSNDQIELPAKLDAKDRAALDKLVDEMKGKAMVADV